MPGDPINGLIARLETDDTASEELHGYFTESFGLDEPLWQQYLDFWRGLLQGDLGPSIAYVGSSVSDLIRNAVPYTLALLVPAIVLSYIAGNRVGALAARRKVARQLGAAGVVHPHRDAVHVARARARLRVRLPAGRSSRSRARTTSRSSPSGAGSSRAASSATGSAVPVALPRLLRRLGDRDAQPDHLRARGRLRELPPVARRAERLVRRYAYRNAILPQMSGLALALGAVVGGALVTEIVFGYPGVGSLILTAVQSRDYFLLQGTFLFIIVGVLIANFIVDIAYVIVDPRTRVGIQGS